jgi:hypothetical protein
MPPGEHRPVGLQLLRIEQFRAQRRLTLGALRIADALAPPQFYISPVKNASLRMPPLPRRVNANPDPSLCADSVHLTRSARETIPLRVLRCSTSGAAIASAREESRVIVETCRHRAKPCAASKYNWEINEVLAWRVDRSG